MGRDANIAYDTSKLDLLSGLNRNDVLLAGMFASELGWTIDTYTDEPSGVVRLSVFIDRHRLPVLKDKLPSFLSVSMLMLAWVNHRSPFLAIPTFHHLHSIM